MQLPIAIPMIAPSPAAGLRGAGAGGNGEFGKILTIFAIDGLISTKPRQASSSMSQYSQSRQLWWR